MSQETVNKIGFGCMIAVLVATPACIALGLYAVFISMGAL